MELEGDVHGMKVHCMLNSGATRSFVYPSVFFSVSLTISKGALPTVTVASGKKVVCSEIAEVDLVF